MMHSGTSRPALSTAPLLDHPVVVRVDAGERELLVVRLEEGLAAEPGERREAQRRLDPVELHVVDAGLRLVATRSHLVVRDRQQTHVVALEAHRGDVPLVRVHQALVEPDVARRAVVAELVLVAGAADELQAAEPVALDLRAVLRELRREPPLEQVRRLDDVVVDTHDLREIGAGVARP